VLAACERFGVTLEQFCAQRAGPQRIMVAYHRLRNREVREKDEWRGRNS